MKLVVDNGPDRMCPSSRAMHKRRHKPPGTRKGRSDNKRNAAIIVCDTKNEMMYRVTLFQDGLALSTGNWNRTLCNGGTYGAVELVLSVSIAQSVVFSTIETYERRLLFTPNRSTTLGF